MHDRYTFSGSGVGVHVYEAARVTEIDEGAFVRAAVRGTNPRPVMEAAATAPPTLEIGQDPKGYEKNVLGLEPVDEGALDGSQRMIVEGERALLTGAKAPHNGPPLAIDNAAITFYRKGPGLITKVTARIAPGLEVATYMTPLDPEQLAQHHPRDQEGVAGHDVKAILLQSGDTFVDISKRATWHPLRGGSTNGGYDQHSKTAKIGVPLTAKEVAEAMHEMHHAVADDDPFASLGNATESDRKRGKWAGLSPEAGLLVGAEETFAWRGALRDLASLRDRGFPGIDDALLQELTTHAVGRMATYKEGLPETAEIEQAFSLEDIPREDKDRTLAAILKNSLDEAGLTDFTSNPLSLARGLSWPPGVQTVDDWVRVTGDQAVSELAVDPDVIRYLSLMMFRHSPRAAGYILTEAERYVLTALDDPAPEGYEQKRAKYFELLRDLSKDTVLEGGSYGWDRRVSAYFGFQDDPTHGQSLLVWD